MALTPRLEIRQSQTLVMTPQLQQAIKLLQYSNLELSSFVEQEVEKNPLLEIGDRPEPAAADRLSEPPDWASSDDGPAHAAEGSSPEPAGIDTKLGEPGYATPGDEAPLKTAFENEFSSAGPADGTLGDSSAVWSSVSGSGRFDDGADRLEPAPGQSQTLRDHLLDQLPDSLMAPTEQLIGRYLIDMINSDGYLTDSVDAIAERLFCPTEAIEKTLGIMQGLGPAGVFARNLKECLALQLADRDRLDPVMETFLNHLDLVAKHDFAALKRVCGVDDGDLSDMIAEIKALNPRPGAAFFSEPLLPVVPDVYVRASPDGGWAVELNSGTLPKVLVNRRYFTEISGSAKSKSDKTFISDCLTTANWLVKALDQRARTILKVATEIVRQQSGFLENGVHYLRPLNLRTVAQAIDMHESTVSRVTSNKYMATSRGIFELKYFFTSGVGSEDNGILHSAEAVRHRIKEMVDNEGADAVLSDDKMVEILRAAGVDVARRTVAKYRESINIPSSVQRRRMKKMEQALKQRAGDG
ncbi:MAG: RNA polymerase factor sigma-54 [Sphingomonadales bacterium]